MEQTGSRTEKKKEETRKKIIAVAMELFNRQGFNQTTMEQIALAADVARGTVYNHFPEKEAIVHEYVQGVISEQGPELINHIKQLPDTRSRLIEALQKSLEWMHIGVDKEIFEVYFNYRLQKGVSALRDMDTSMSSSFKKVLVHILEMGKEAGEIRPDMHSKILASYLEPIHYMAVSVYLVFPELFSIQDGIAANVDLFLNGAKKQDGQ